MMTDWQIERQQEQQTFTQIAQDVAKIMGWQFQAPQDGDRCCYITDGTQWLTIGLVWNHKSRVYARGSFHQQQLQNFLPYKAENPEITVAISRGAAVIAKEISRRVLPAYSDLLQKAQTSKNAENAYQAKIKHNAAAVLNLLHAEGDLPRLGNRDERTVFFKGGEANINAESIDLKLEGLSVEQVKAVLQVLHQGTCCTACSEMSDNLNEADLCPSCVTEEIQKGGN